MNRTGTYYERSNADSRQCYLNVDSLLDCIDTTNIKTSKGARAFPIVQPLLDSLCTTKELCELTSRSYSAAVRLAATDALIRRKYAHLEDILLSNYTDTTRIGVCSGDVGWEEVLVVCSYVMFSRVEKRRSLVKKILCAMTH